MGIAMLFMKWKVTPPKHMDLFLIIPMGNKRHKKHAEPSASHLLLQEMKTRCPWRQLQWLLDLSANGKALKTL
jgi:hypothetical protein